MDRRLLILSLIATAASASPPASEPLQAASDAVRAKLVKPLEQKELARSRFTRAPLPPAARRIRIDEREQRDATGEVFHAFAVDEKLGRFVDERGPDEGWRAAVRVGCVYASGEVFVTMGGKTFPAQIVVGKKAAAAPTHVCRGEELAAR